MKLLDYKTEKINRVHYVFESNDGVTINYFRLETLDGEVLKEDIVNKNGHPIDPILDSKCIELVKLKVQEKEK